MGFDTWLQNAAGFEYSSCGFAVEKSSVRIETCQKAHGFVFAGNLDGSFSRFVVCSVTAVN